MNKKIISIFSLILLPLSATAVEMIGVKDSGIDWSASELTLIDFTDQNGVTGIFDCFGLTAIGDTTNLGELFSGTTDGSERGAETDTIGCHTAGDYEFEIRLVDKAGNVSTQAGYKLKVFPGDADSTHIVLDYTDCNTANTTGIIADGTTSCSVGVVVEDQYGNEFGGFNNGAGNRVVNSLVKLSVMGKRPRDKFNYFDHDTDELFRDGLIIPANTLLNKLGQSSFDIQAKAPSLNIIQGKGTNAQVSRLVEKSVDLLLEFETVNDDGTLNLVIPNQLSITENFKFHPWVKSLLYDPDGDTSTGLEKLEVDEDGSAVELQVTTESLKSLPTGLSTNLRGLPPVAIDMKLGNTPTFDVLTSGDDLSVGKSISFSPGGTSQIKNGIFLKLVKAIGISEVLEWGLTTQIIHNIPGATVTYPGGNLGDSAFKDSSGNYVTGYDSYVVDPNCIHCDGTVMGGSITFIGADIEGQVRSSQDVFALGQKSGQGHIVNMGGVSVQDTREKIVKNAYALYRGTTPLVDGSDVSLLAGIDFTAIATGVAYYKGGTVTLGGPITGKGTIIIVDGNLVIEDNMTYNTPATDSLGVILINTTVTAPVANKIRETGNIFVRSDVQKMVGTYFADGSLLSVTPVEVISTPAVAYTYPAGVLQDQLLLNGTLFTYNTLGGSEVLNEDGNFSTPWGNAVDLDEAITYDIHHIRRYDSTGSCVTNTNNGAGCDTNNFAFIIRPDGKVKNLTPPGFKDAATSYRE